MRRATVLEDVEALPCTEKKPPVFDGDRELSRQQGGTDMRGHVVGSFVVVAIAAASLRHERAKEVGKIALHLRRGILLDEE